MKCTLGDTPEKIEKNSNQEYHCSTRSGIGLESVMTRVNRPIFYCLNRISATEWAVRVTRAKIGSGPSDSGPTRPIQIGIGRFCELWRQPCFGPFFEFLTSKRPIRPVQCVQNIKNYLETKFGIFWIFFDIFKEG